MNQNELFYSLLRLSLGIAHDFPADVSADTWQQLYEMSVKQSLVGVCYQGVCQLPPAQQPPLQLAMQWACEAEAIRGMNIQQNEEAARLTQLFAAEGRKTAILKGQANARLYPDKFSRTPGDIDIWVEGGRDSVIALLKKMGLIDKLVKTEVEGEAIESYHHIHLPMRDNNIIIEVHFRLAAKGYNPLTNGRLQGWLQRMIQKDDMTNEGFYVPSVRFALVMQLAHIHNHFTREGGIGLRQLIDYYWLLRNASAEDLKAVRSNLRGFGLINTARAIMWILCEELHLDEEHMLLKPDEFRGKWMLCDIMTGGNFGHFRNKDQTRYRKKVLMTRWQHIKMMRFDFWEFFWIELTFWNHVIKTLPERFKKRTIFLSKL